VCALPKTRIPAERALHRRPRLQHHGHAIWIALPFSCPHCLLQLDRILLWQERRAMAIREQKILKLGVDHFAMSLAYQLFK
jgi:hypothetical protein